MAGATPPFPIMPGASMCSLAVSLACWRFGFAARTYLGDRRSGMVHQSLEPGSITSTRSPAKAVTLSPPVLYAGDPMRVHFLGPLSAERRLSAHPIDEPLQGGFERPGNFHIPPQGDALRGADACCDFVCAAEHLLEIASYFLAEHDVGEVLCLGNAHDRLGREGLFLPEIR